LEQVFSDVWGPAPPSVGKHQYYVSFIDDFSKFTWIYLLKKRSDVYQAFLNFQQYVEHKFDRKIVTMQTDWGVSMRSSTLSFKRLALLIMFHVLMPINKMALLNANIVI
jgi:histone deacetylase 1/2